jgi:type II secretory pathway pseudopilin PulG
MFELRLRRGLGVVFVIVALLVSPAATADDDRVERLERELEALRAAVAALQAEQMDADRLAEIERKLDVLAAELEDLKVGEAAVVASQEATVYGLAPAASKVYRTETGLSIGGYGEALLEVFDSTRDDGAPSGKVDTFDLLRGVLYFGYKFNDRFVFNSEIEFEHSSTDKEGSASVEFAYVDWLWRPELNVRGGLLLVPMGFVNELHEPTTFLGAKRPETETRIIPTTWRENGAGIHGDLGGFSYRTYIVNGFDASGFSSSGLRGGRQKGSKAKAEDLAWVGRVDWTGTPGLTVGLSAYVGDSGQDLVDDTGRSIDVGTTIWEAHADWRWRGLQVRGLWSEADLDDVAELNEALGYQGADSVGERMEGGYVEIGYDLLSRRQGSQALIPYLRWEQVDTQAEVPVGYQHKGATDVEVLTLGLAYQPIEQLILKVDWQDREDAAGTGVDQFNVGLGYIF